MVLRDGIRKKCVKRPSRGGGEDNKNIIRDFRDWEALPEGLLDLILQRLQLLDRLSFSKVCKSWRTFYKQGFFFNNQQARIPWLMMMGPHCSTLRIGYSILEDVRYQLEHPDFRWRTIWGSFQDWLILLNKDEPCTYDICLLNPFSRQRLYLPPLSGIYTKLLLSSSPCDGNCVFMLVGTRVAFWVRAVPTWHELLVRHGPYIDGVFSQGCFYILNKEFNNLMVYDVQHKEVRSRNLPIKMLDERISCSWQSYMVQSGNDVLLVYQYFNPQHETKRIDLYRLDGREEAWVKVESLDGRVLVIGRNCSTEELGIGMANCIFFPYSHRVLLFPLDYVDDFASGSRIDEWGIFDMDKHDVKNFASRPSSRMVGAMWLSAPAWWYSTSSRGMAMRRQPQRRNGVKTDKMWQKLIFFCC